MTLEMAFKCRMYCGGGDERSSCQTVQYLLLEAITKTCAPILPHLSEEVIQFHPLNAGQIFFTCSVPLC